MQKAKKVAIGALFALILISAYPGDCNSGGAGQPTQIDEKNIAEREHLNSPCEIGDDKRNSELCAQWKAADAAADSAKWSEFSFWLAAFVGTLTLMAAAAAAYYARLAALYTQAGALEAKKSAATGIEAVNISEDTARKQLRAYVCIEECILIEEEDLLFFSAQILIKNYGQTPAYDVKITAKAKTIGSSIFEFFDISVSNTQATEPTILGPSAAMTKSIYNELQIDELTAITTEICNIFIIGIIEYRDIYNSIQSTNFVLRVRNYGTKRQRIHPHTFGNYAS